MNEELFKALIIYPNLKRYVSLEVIESMLQVPYRSFTKMAFIILRILSTSSQISILPQLKPLLNSEETTEVYNFSLLINKLQDKPEVLVLLQDLKPEKAQEIIIEKLLTVLAKHPAETFRFQREIRAIKDHAQSKSNSNLQEIAEKALLVKMAPIHCKSVF